MSYANHNTIEIPRNVSITVGTQLGIIFLPEHTENREGYQYIEEKDSFFNQAMGVSDIDEPAQLLKFM